MHDGLTMGFRWAHVVCSVTPALCAPLSTAHCRSLPRSTTRCPPLFSTLCHSLPLSLPFSGTLSGALCHSPPHPSSIIHHPSPVTHHSSAPRPSPPPHFGSMESHDIGISGRQRLILGSSTCPGPLLLVRITTRATSSINELNDSLIWSISPLHSAWATRGKFASRSAAAGSLAIASQLLCDCLAESNVTQSTKAGTRAVVSGHVIAIPPLQEMYAKTRLQTSDSTMTVRTNSLANIGLCTLLHADTLPTASRFTLKISY